VLLPWVVEYPPLVILVGGGRVMTLPLPLQEPHLQLLFQEWLCHLALQQSVFII
jgi:hypothetical protein